MRRPRALVGSVPTARSNPDRIARAAKCAVETLESRVLLSVNVTSYHYDAGETGANTNETVLTQSNVNVSTFGKVASLPVDGQIYAQPLVVMGVSLPAGGTEDLVFVATEHDSVYAFNAEGTSTTYVWKTSLLQSGETTIPAGDTGTNDITPEIGITSTPVINTATNTIYVEGNFKESNGTYQQRLYALNITTGANVVSPVIISGTVNGTGAGSSGGKINFNAQLENQRPALTLANGQVYVTFASHGDNGNYHGWVVAYNQSTLAQDYLWCNTPNGSQGGIWMSGGGLAVDSSGDLYLTSGNGSFDANTGGSDYGMAFVKLSSTLQVLDYFSPYNEASLSNADQDYGCGNAILLPTQTGSAPDEGVTLGKWGGVYLNNTDTGKMGEINNPPNGPNKDLGEANTNLEQHNTFAYWNGEVYITPDGGTLRDYAVGNSTLTATPTSQSSHVYGTSGPDGQGAGVSVSSNGTSNGIVWALDNTGFNSNPAVLYAYNANNLTQVLWTSSQAAGGRDTCGDAVKFTTPVVANGYVYVGGAGTLTLYSNIPYSPPPPPPPPAVGSVKGFTSSAWTLNTGGTSGVPAISADNSTLTLTTATGNEASSAYFDTPVTYQNFTASFTYTAAGGNPPADGITFNLQNDSRGVSALGATGGALGYSGISPSFAVELNVYQVSSTAIDTNGNANQPHGVANTGAVNLASGDPINVTLAYNSEQLTLTETLTDTVTKATYSTIYGDINLSAILGVNTFSGSTTSADVGFTGGTGGAEALQTITNFTYTTSANEPAAATLPSGATSITGFANNWLNGISNDPAGLPGVSADNNTLTLTTAAGTEATSAFNATPVDYGNFNASFVYTESGTSPADGVAFTLQDTPGLGQTGGQLGYGPSIPNSFAVEFNIYEVSSTAVGAGGTIAVPYVSNVGSVNLASGDPIKVNLTYSSPSQTLTEKLADTVTNATSTTTYNNINLTQYLGNSLSAYVGFTGGTGGADAGQTVSEFSYSANASGPLVPAGPQVNLNGYFNGYGIQVDGTADVPTGIPNGGPFAVPGGGTTGYDGGGYQLSYTYFGSTTNPSSQAIAAYGTTQTFDFGAAGAPDTISAAGQTINLPHGSYGNISFIGSGVNGNQAGQVFTVNYTDGTSQTYSIGMSDWFSGPTFAPNEVVAIPMTYRLNPGGGVDSQGSNIAAYEYQLATNPAKTVASITLPMNTNDKILAMNVNAAPAVTHISPATGPAAGGTTVTITGTGFTGATAVDFGSTAASNFTINASGTQITATDPAGSGTVDVTVTGPYGTSLTSAADQFTYAAALPAWLSPTSAATWNASTHTLTVTGSATIIADPGTDEPNIVASGAAAKLAVTPSTSPTDVHIGGITLSNGATMTMTSVGSSRTHSDHNVLVLGTMGSASDPTLSVDATSKLDLSDNDMIVHTGTSDANGASAYAALVGLAEKGRNPAGGAPGQPDGQWNGDGLTSSAAAAADLSAGYEKIGLGIAVNNTILIGQFNAWQVGSSSENLSANDIIVKYDYLADYAFEGEVSQDDAGILQLEYDKGATTGHTWSTGSSLYDGLSDNTEAGLMQLQYGLGTGGTNGPQL